MIAEDRLRVKFWHNIARVNRRGHPAPGRAREAACVTISARSEEPFLVRIPHTMSTRHTLAGLLVACLAAGCGGGGESTAPDTTASETAAPAPEASAGQAATAEGDGPIFIDRATEAGLEFVHFNGMTGEFYMAEVTGSGGALFDYDRDGDLDVYLIQGQLLGPDKTVEDATFAPRYPLPLTDRLYRNDLDSGPGGEPRLAFTDVTEEVGLAAYGYGMSVAVADYDGDGWLDLYLTNFDGNQFLRNSGPGPEGRITFEDVTEETGTGDERWSVPAAFFDYDADGDLDLFVGNYIAADVENRRVCRDFTGALDYCGPGAYTAEPDRLLRNEGPGSGGRVGFKDVSRDVGLGGHRGSALGVVTADFDGDGWLDVYVTNDGQPNNLWINSGPARGFTFTDEALMAGSSVNSAGKPEASMGVDAADFDGDGDLDLFMTHLTGETNTLYRNDGTGLFDDETIATGLGSPSRPFTSFGTGFFDYDNDGWLDIFVANGAVKKIEALAREQDPFPVHQPNQLFHNLGTRGGGRVEYVEVTERAGEVFELSEVSRGTAFGDVDNDGDTDVLLINNAGPARLLINQVGTRAHWLGVRLLEAEGEREALHTRLEVVLPDGRSLWRRVRTEGSFGSANDPRVLFGLGENAEIEVLRAHRLDGTVEEWRGLETGRYHTLRLGSGDTGSGDKIER